MASKIIESLRDDLAALREAGAVRPVTVREFDAICLPLDRKSGADSIEPACDAGYDD